MIHVKDCYRMQAQYTLAHSVMPNSLWPMDCSPPGSSVYGIFQARILKWVAVSFSRGSSWIRYRTLVFCIGGQILHHWGTREVLGKVRVTERNGKWDFIGIWKVKLKKLRWHLKKYDKVITFIVFGKQTNIGPLFSIRLK